MKLLQQMSFENIVTNREIAHNDVFKRCLMRITRVICLKLERVKLTGYCDIVALWHPMWNFIGKTSENSRTFFKIYHIIFLTFIWLIGTRRAFSLTSPGCVDWTIVTSVALVNVLISVAKEAGWTI